jgi:hypothetical protein
MKTSKKSIYSLIRFYTIIIIISLLMSPLLGYTGLPYGLYIRNTTHNPPRGRWLPTTANATGTDGLTCLPKHGGARDSKFLITHPMTDQRCLTSAIARRNALTAGPSSSSRFYIVNEYSPTALHCKV